MAPEMGPLLLSATSLCSVPCDGLNFVCRTTSDTLTSDHVEDILPLRLFSSRILRDVPDHRSPPKPAETPAAFMGRGAAGLAGAAGKFSSPIDGGIIGDQGCGSGR